jgi:hypothetical protein
MVQAHREKLLNASQQTQSKTAPASSTDQIGNKSEEVKVVGRVSRITVSSAVIRTIRRNSLLKRSVRISGNTISAARGFTMWGLSNGGAVVVESVYAAESIPAIPKLINGKVVLTTYLCYCSGSGGNDPCQFAREADGTAINLGKCQNATCCEKHCVWVDEEGYGHEC